MHTEALYDFNARNFYVLIPDGCCGMVFQSDDTGVNNHFRLPSHQKAPK